MISHDELADLLSRVILNKFRSKFGNVYISKVSMDFPRPDFVYIPYNHKSGLPIAFEVKTPYARKHEYLTGIGQAVSYNTIFPLSYLVVPDFNIEGFKVVDFVQNVVDVNRLNIGIIEYKIEEPNNVKIIKEALPTNPSKDSLKQIRSIRRSYSYWRETYPYEVFEALKIAKELEKSSGSILNEVLSRLWETVLSKRFKKAKRPSSFLLNYKLFLLQNALLDATGRLTIIGRHVLTLGEYFGGDSEMFKEVITYVMLKYGGHYLLLSKIYEIQEKMSKQYLSNPDQWVNKIEKELRNQDYYISKDDFNINFPRLPYAYKNIFCGIAEPKFNQGKGLFINFPKIISILEKGSKLFSSIEDIISQ